MNNFKVVIATCKKYECIAEWSDKIYKRMQITPVFITDSLLNIECEQLIINHEVWTNRLLNAIKNIEENFILLMLDDYIVINNNIKSIINNSIEILNEEKLSYLRLVEIPNSKSNKLISCDEFYGINLQPSIWSKDKLIRALEKINGSPWDFEVNINKNFECKDNFFISAQWRNSGLNVYNAVIKGKVKRNYNKILQKQKIYINNTLPVMTLNDEFIYSLKMKISAILGDSKLGNIVRKIARKFKIQSYRSL